MAQLLKSPKRKMTDTDLVISWLVDCEFLETKEEFDLMKNALLGAIEWARKVK